MMHRFRPNRALLALLGSPLPLFQLSHASADEIVLRNGASLQGRILSRSQHDIFFVPQGEQAGRHIELTEIARFDWNGTTEILAPESKPPAERKSPVYARPAAQPPPKAVQAPASSRPAEIGRQVRRQVTALGLFVWLDAPRREPKNYWILQDSGTREVVALQWTLAAPSGLRVWGQKLDEPGLRDLVAKRIKEQPGPAPRRFLASFLPDTILELEVASAANGSAVFAPMLSLFPGSSDDVVELRTSAALRRVPVLTNAKIRPLSIPEPPRLEPPPAAPPEAVQPEPPRIEPVLSAYHAAHSVGTDATVRLVVGAAFTLTGGEIMLLPEQLPGPREFKVVISPQAARVLSDEGSGQPERRFVGRDITVKGTIRNYTLTDRVRLVEVTWPAIRVERAEQLKVAARAEDAAK